MGVELFAVPYACSLLLFCVMERCIHAALCLMFRVSPWKHMAAQGVLTWAVQFLASLAYVGARTGSNAFVRLLGLWIRILVLLLVLAILYVTFNDYPSTWLGFVAFYNAWLGPFLNRYVLTPLSWLDVAVRGIVPLYDAALWVVKSLIAQSLVPTILYETTTVLQIATTLLDAMEALSNSFAAFVDSFECVGGACFVQELRVFDLLTPLSHLRETVALARSLLTAFCSATAAPLDILIFPLLDLNFSEGLHNLLNFALQLWTVMPQMTYARCGLAPQDTFHTMLCTPDLEPAMNYLAAGIADLGVAGDNWINAAFLVVQTVLTGSSPTCPAQPGPAPLDAWVSGAAVFGSNFTAIVGLTDWMYAVTDGATAVYVGNGAVATQKWPYSMDASLGVAAVTYGGASDIDASPVTGANTASSAQTTAMLACRCTDLDAGGFEIVCAILPYAGAAGKNSAYLLQVLFPDELAAPAIGRCDLADISVHSNRFPATRVSSDLPMPDCATRGSCREVDATIYVVPRCGAASGEGCVTSSCYPFCMAARDSGSQNNNLLLVQASRWRTGYTVLAQAKLVLKRF